MTSATVTAGGGGAAFDADWACEWLQAASSIVQIEMQINVKMAVDNRKTMGRSVKLGS
jgi:hypothetical protein